VCILRIKSRKLEDARRSRNKHFKVKSSKFDRFRGTKKCGHMGGKVLVNTQEHIDRLVAARLANDILGTNLILVARTDAEAATLLDSNIDSRDHPFILGVTRPGLPSLRDALMKTSDNVNAANQWAKKAKLMTFGEAVLAQINSLGVSHARKEQMRARWLQCEPNTLSNTKARQLADSIFGRKNSVSSGNGLSDRAGLFCLHLLLFWVVGLFRLGIVSRP
jgi:isocitrate lyase